MAVSSYRSAETCWVGSAGRPDTRQMLLMGAGFLEITAGGGNQSRQARGLRKCVCGKETESCSFLTDSCKFPTDEIIYGYSKDQFGPQFAQNRSFSASKFCIFGRKNLPKNSDSLKFRGNCHLPPCPATTSLGQPFLPIISFFPVAYLECEEWEGRVSPRS